MQIMLRYVFQLCNTMHIIISLDISIVHEYMTGKQKQRN